MKGLKGEALPLGARIFAIVDVFDALSSRRPYQEPLPVAEAPPPADGICGVTDA
ncbi:MAG: HD domain-containing phosphohydrolase [Pseudomonadota bacterium]